MAKKPAGDVSIGKFDILATGVYAHALLDGMDDDEAKQRSMVTAIMASGSAGHPKETPRRVPIRKIMISCCSEMPERTDDDDQTQRTGEYPPGKKSVSVTASIKAKVETEAKALIEHVLRPKYVLPPKGDEKFNYIIDLGTKWLRITSTSTRSTPAPVRMRSRPHSSRSLPGWNTSATTGLPFLSCGIRANGLPTTTHFRLTSA